MRVLGAAVLMGLVFCASCAVDVEAPKANPAIQQTTSGPATTAGAPAGAASSQPSPGQQAAAKSVVRHPKLDGFKEIAFGMQFDKVKKDKAVKSRCKDRLEASTFKDDYADQKTKRHVLYCTANLAGRLTEMNLKFDHNKELYAVEFSFEEPELFGGSKAAGDRQKLNTEDDVNKFVADVRAILDPELGQPLDLSERRLTGRNIALKWGGTTSDQPPHESSVLLSLRTGLNDRQFVVWTDDTREAALDAAIEKEKTERVKAQGL
ncbi:MAG: hypothetical protein M0R80_24985 [Proteobacteria bacterium]|jgi:hypothetical protein|nr:hypothetical protein [Pseudomonadota bacterium]